MVSLQIKPRGKPIKTLPESIEIDLATARAEELYKRLAAITGLSEHRLRLTKGSDNSHVQRKRVDGKSVTVEETGLRDGSVVFVKDLGPQISWRLVFFIEYLGPILIHPLFLYVFRPYLYSNSRYNPLSRLPFAASIGSELPSPTSNQHLLCFLITLHFIKRELETLLVHRFSSATMPLNNVFRNAAHYWITSGIVLAYFIYWPSLSPAAFWWPESLNADKNPNAMYAAVALWVFSELSNLHTHITLRNLRPEGSTKRQIPRGYGFGLVTCPNYLFETLAWVAVLVLSGGNWAALAFLVSAACPMMIWAKNKERRYRKEFGSAYRKKSAMFPLIW